MKESVKRIPLAPLGLWALKALMMMLPPWELNSFIIILTIYIITFIKSIHCFENELCQVFEQLKLGGQEGVRGQEDVLYVDGDVVDDDGCDGEVSAGVVMNRQEVCCRRWIGAQVDKDDESQIINSLLGFMNHLSIFDCL